jgi:hypothetical protein
VGKLATFVAASRQIHGRAESRDGIFGTSAKKRIPASADRADIAIGSRKIGICLAKAAAPGR